MSRPRSTNRLRVSTVCQAIPLTVASATVWILGLVFVGGIVGEFFRETQPGYEQHQFIFRADGLPVWMTLSIRRGAYVKTEFRDLDGNLVEMVDKDEGKLPMLFVDSRIWQQPRRATWQSDVVSLNSSENEPWFFEDFGTRGQFTLFDGRSKQCVGWIGQQGFSSTPLSEEQKFPTRSGTERFGNVGINDGWTLTLGWMMSSYQPSGRQVTSALLIEPGGRRVHWIDWRSRTSRLIHDGEPVWAACFWRSNDLKPDPLRVALRTQDSLLIVAPNEIPSVVETLRLPDSVRRAALLECVRTSDGPLFVEPMFSDGWRLTWASPDGTVIRERIVPQRDTFTSGDEGRWSIPLIQLPAFADFTAWGITHLWDSELRNIDHRRARDLGLSLGRARPDIEWNQFVAPLSALHVSVALWSWFAIRRLRRFGASVGEQFFWGAWMLAFGLPGYLAFRVHRTWGRFSTCPAEVLSSADWSLKDGQVENLPHDRRGTSAMLGGVLDAAEERGLDLLARVGLSPRHAALVVKELRLVAIIAAAACAAYLLVIAKLTNVTGFGWMRTFVQERGVVPFLSDGFAEPFSVVTFLLAVWLAVWQTASESRGGAWLFLLHRPVSRRAIVLSKVVVGLSVLLVCSALPIVLYGAWADRPGTHASPFAWSMTIETWRLWWSMPPLYLGTLLTMLRPARWFGTRLLPCVAGFGWLVCRESFGMWLWPTWQEFAVVAVIDLVFAACLLLVVREREYPS